MPRPNLIVLNRATNLRLENITLQNSPKFHFVPTECAGVVISNVTVLAPSGAANTDAIDPSNCRQVLITKCLIDVGDDNIAIKAGKPVEGREFACEDITVTDCTFLHGHGMSIGSETAGNVRIVLVNNCTFENTENGIRIKSQRGKGGLVGRSGKGTPKEIRLHLAPAQLDRPQPGHQPADGKYHAAKFTEISFRPDRVRGRGHLQRHRAGPFGRG